MNNFIIAPSILSADFTRLGADIAACEAAGADWIHVDVMDGRFAPNLTMGPVIVEACRRSTKLPLDVHLMIEEPERHIEAFAKAGASHITVHVETCPHLHRTLQQIKSLGCKAGVTLNPSTPASAIEPVLPARGPCAGAHRQPRLFGTEIPSRSPAEDRTSPPRVGQNWLIRLAGGGWRPFVSDPARGPEKWSECLRLG